MTRLARLPIPIREPVLTPRVGELLEMLTYMRPAGSNAEEAFIRRYLDPLGTIPDEYGNHWLTIGDAPILWSSHTDTVHKNSGKQRITYGDGVVTVEVPSNCLGADCTVGVWIMRQMILANVPGTYVFHRAEEIGGLGSTYIANETPERLDGILYAIAFDRAGTTDIVTHQMSDKLVSDTFVDSLEDVLLPLRYFPTPGVFTDTAMYGGLIPECTNLSVGYHSQHTSREWQDVDHAEDLLDRVLAADWSRLTAARDPADAYVESFSATSPWDHFGEGARTFGKRSSKRDPDPWGNTPASLVRYVRDNPKLVADYLHYTGTTIHDIEPTQDYLNADNDPYAAQEDY